MVLSLLYLDRDFSSFHCGSLHNKSLPMPHAETQNFVDLRYLQCNVCLELVYLPLRRVVWKLGGFSIDTNEGVLNRRASFGDTEVNCKPSGLGGAKAIVERKEACSSSWLMVNFARDEDWFYV